MEEYTYTYERREPIRAVRGEIYDREGRKLIYNTYSYDLVFDYDAMAATQLDRNYAILQVIDALSYMGDTEKMSETSFPFEGIYPNYTYSSKAKDTRSNIYYRLLKRIAENELEDQGDRSKTELDAAYLEGLYASHPEYFPTESELIEHYLEKYKLNSKDENGTAVFTDAEIDAALRMRYDMEVADFSIYNRYVVAKDLELSSISYIKELSVLGADVETRTHRNYGYPGYASHILGQTGSIPAEKWEDYQKLGYEMNAIVGISGCEKAFEEYLRGVDGVRVIVEDENGKIIDSYVEKEAVAGKDVYLTIDIDIQIAAEDGLAYNIESIDGSEAGAITAVDPNNGEVFAIASYPTYDLSTYNQDYDKITGNPANPLYNRALDGLYAPGSTFKLGMVAAGISNGTFSDTTRVDCTGIYTYYQDYTPKCWVYPGSHGRLNAAGALCVSCNCYFYELGRLMGIETMNKYCKAYGLGEYTGIELAEKKGILAGPDYREQNGLEMWTPGNTISAAIGQSDNTFTPLQIASYVATVLNGGDRYSAHLLLKVCKYGSGDIVYLNDGEILSRAKLSGDAVAAVKEGMRQMVESSYKVSHNMRNVPVTVGGKTGTAELGGSTTENGLFVCAAPYNDPEIVVSAVIEHAGGGSYASYAAAQVLEEYYN
jgi:penicillin-binding protein 2